ncbi:hypothetical protein AMTRI_Chr02g218040 [Amborella trichopoda]
MAPATSFLEAISNHEFIELFCLLLHCHLIHSITFLSFSLRKPDLPERMAESGMEFEDFLPVMAEKMGEEEFMVELCKGFQVLMDKSKGLITFKSLKRNSGILGLQGLSDEEVMEMVREGDLDRDGGLNQMEFCILMFRLSPALMEGGQKWLGEALVQELHEIVDY